LFILLQFPTYTDIPHTSVPAKRPTSYGKSQSSQAKNISISKSKREVVPVHVMKAYRVSRVIAPPILNLGGKWKRVITFTILFQYHRERIQCP
jgi:hypothetical protein